MRCEERWLLLIAVSCLVGTLAGCGRKSSLNVAPVSGSVSYAGERLKLGQVVFVPIEGTRGPQAIGEIQPDGTFRMETSGADGAVVGKHRATIHSRRPPTEQERQRLVITESLIPERYSREDQSPLTFDIEDRNNVLAIELE